jgi:uncharacterized protein YbjT (DUF2867 family)
MRILVSGGSGVLGHQVVERLVSAGQNPIVLSRRASRLPGWVRGDIATGEGLPEALAGVDVVVHAASAAAEFTRIKATDVEGTRRLVAAAEAAGVKHLIYISIVGVGSVPYFYYRAKAAAEATIKGGTVPWTILRATQFHELIDRIFRASRGPFVFVPRSISFQPVDSGDVAERLAELATSSPAGLLDDFGGPEILTSRELAQAWLARRGLRKSIVGIPVPGRTGRGFRAGQHLCPDRRQGGVTWHDWIGRAYAGGRVPTAYGRKSQSTEDT